MKRKYHTAEQIVNKLSQAAADRALREVFKEIDRKIADGTLKPYENRDLWIAPGE